MSNSEGIVDAWVKAAAALRLAQEAERSLRDQIVELYFTDPAKGVNNHMLPDGRIVKYTHNVKTAIVGGQANIETIAKVAKDGGLDPSALLVAKYELNNKTFAGLNAKQKALFSKFVETKVAAPDLKVV